MDGPARLAMLESSRSMTSARTTTTRTSHAVRSGRTVVASGIRRSVVTNTVLLANTVRVNANGVRRDSEHRSLDCAHVADPAATPCRPAPTRPERTGGPARALRPAQDADHGRGDHQHGVRHRRK